MSGLPQHLLLPSFLLLFPFFLVLLLTPAGESIQCFECIWYEDNNTLNLNYKKSRFCSREYFNSCRAPAREFLDGHLCISIAPKKKYMNGIILVGLPHSNATVRQKCKDDKSITLFGKTIEGKICACDEDFCNAPPAAGSSPAPALGSLLLSGLMHKLV